jgi:hypothetical protein
MYTHSISYTPSQYATKLRSGIVDVMKRFYSGPR